MSAYPGEAFIAWEAFVTPPGSGAGTSGLGKGGQKCPELGSKVCVAGRRDPSHQPHGMLFGMGEGAGVGTCSLWARAQSELYSILSLLINSNSI